MERLFETASGGWKHCVFEKKRFEFVARHKTIRTEFRNRKLFTTSRGC